MYQEFYNTQASQRQIQGFKGAAWHPASLRTCTVLKSLFWTSLVQVFKVKFSPIEDLAPIRQVPLVVNLCGGCLVFQFSNLCQIFSSEIAHSSLQRHLCLNLKFEPSLATKPISLPNYWRVKWIEFITQSRKFLWFLFWKLVAAVQSVCFVLFFQGFELIWNEAGVAEYLDMCTEHWNSFHENSMFLIFKLILLLVCVFAKYSKNKTEAPSKLFFHEANKAATKAWNAYTKMFFCQLYQDYLQLDEMSITISGEKENKKTEHVFADKMGFSNLLQQCCTHSVTWKRQRFVTKQSLFSLVKKKVFEYHCYVYKKREHRRIFFRNGRPCSWVFYTENQTFATPSVASFGFDTNLHFSMCFKNKEPIMYSKQEYVVPRASGNVNVKYLKGNAQFFFGNLFDSDVLDLYWLYTQCITWTYTLDRKLSLNLTFHSLYFSRRPTQAFCKQGSVLIQAKRTDKSPFKYCEHHSLFSVYPSFQDIIVNLTTFPLIVIDIDFTYFVLDNGMITTIHEMYPPVSSLKPFSLIMHLSKSSLQTYRIKVQKLETIQVKYFGKESKQLSLFDGPDLLSPEIVTKSGISSSTFQCLIQKQEHHKGQQDADKLVYIPKQRKLPVPIVPNENENISFPNHECTENMCVVVYQAPVFIKINVSVVYFSGDVQLDHNCIFGGLLNVDFYGKNYTDTFALCSTGRNSQTGRNLYSHTSLMAVVLYWYKHRCTINTTLIAGLTSCKHVMVACRGNAIFFNSFEKQSEVLLRDAERNPHFFLFGKTVLVPTGKCSILQFVPNYSNFAMEWRCKIDRLISEKITKPGYQIVYDINTYFGQLPETHKSFCGKDIKAVCQSLHIEGKFTQFCVRSHEKQYCQNKTIVKFSFVHQEGKNDSRLSFYIRTKSPTQKSYLVLERNSYFSADSWMEITVQKTKTHQNNYTKLIEELYFTETVAFNTSMARLFWWLCLLSCIAFGTPQEQLWMFCGTLCQYFVSVVHVFVLGCDNSWKLKGGYWCTGRLIVWRPSCKTRVHLFVWSASSPETSMRCGTKLTRANCQCGSYFLPLVGMMGCWSETFWQNTGSPMIILAKSEVTMIEIIWCCILAFQSLNILGP